MKRIQLLVLCMTALVTASFAAVRPEVITSPNLLGDVQIHSPLKSYFSHDWLQASTSLEDSSEDLSPAARTSLNRDQSEAIRKDARYYARDFGVDIDEAIRRLNLQEAIGLLNFKLATEEADYFGGLYVEHQPVFQVVVLFTRDRYSALRSHLENGPLEGMVTTRLVESSLRELEATQIATSEAFASLHIPFEHDINIRENQVEVYITESNMAQVMQRTNVETLLGSHVKLVTVESLSRKTVGIQGGNL